ncbi:hypothetical protein O6Y01_23035 (plasmid) [Salmonella enterica subsp. enterica]|uniref:hypothetical protein n=1 Tax=Salmonella enterica TaxID=28901 RepID=UPI000EB71D0C|nr:hypothetical protein [Salmonella enterica]AYE25828.1 hypothetical protein CJD41_24120 [Salmonella enterica subsp. enterica serovar Pullorum]
MTPKDLGKFEPQRRYATLAAVVLESTATVIDELVDLHDRILVKLFSGAKHKHQQQFQKQGQGDQRQGAPVLQDRPGAAGGRKAQRPLCAIEAVIPWDDSPEASARPSAGRPEGFDHLHPGRENFATLALHAGLLEVLELRAAPAAQGVRQPCRPA